MSLPDGYKTNRDYFEDALDFLKNHQWLYNYPNTHVVVNNVFKEFPLEWLPYLKNLTNEALGNFALGICEEEAPLSLIFFMKTMQRLKPANYRKLPQINHEMTNNSGLSVKKRHEILSLAPLVGEICQETGCGSVIDVGAGLGYLPQLLYDKYNYSVLGIEGSAEKVDAARFRQSPGSKNSVIYAEHLVTEDSASVIDSLAAQHSVKKACITGLHACADLSVTILDIFAQLDLAKALVIMPCCYHRLRIKSTSGDSEEFSNFPKSRLLKDLTERVDARRFLRTPFLRLACQRSASSFGQMTQEQHETHARNCLFRAILQEVVETENWRVTRLKRKFGKLKPGAATDFEDYLANLVHTHALVGPEIDEVKFSERMREKWELHKENCWLVEVLAAFQAAIQSICENVVLLDRVEFLMEKGMKCCVEKVTGDSISPRCYALVATKQ